VTVARRLAECLSATSVADLPPQTLEHAAMLIASTLASAACGTNLESARIIRDLARDSGGRPDASVWFDARPKLPAARAAQLNAVASDAAASDDSDLRNIVHAGTPLTAVSLAIAERDGIGGEDVLRAMVLGYEAAGRISAAITPGFRERGFHGCLGAIFAAAVASGVLLRLDAPRLAQAIALSATSIGGLATAADTSVAREYHAGLAVLHGVNAALAAQRGYRAELAILETRRGFFEAFGGVDGAAAATAALEGLGESWDIRHGGQAGAGRPSLSRHRRGRRQRRARRQYRCSRHRQHRDFPSGHDGALRPAASHEPDRHGAQPCLLRRRGRGGSRVQLGTCGCLATDPLIHGLIDVVRVGEQPVADAARYRQGATVTIRTRDGRASTSTVYVPKGAGMLGIGWSDVDAKYRALMPNSGLAPNRIEETLELIHGFRQVVNVAMLTTLLH
jgi:2-methylcitrate dehydratase PrpD